MNNLSRNTPVALILGVGGFLGSHVAEKLIEKGLQVVGVDNFSSGDKAHLAEVVKNKNFYLLNQSAGSEILFSFPRLDYAFFLIDTGNLSNHLEDLISPFLEVCKLYKPKIVFASSVRLYDKDEKLDNLKKYEEAIAKETLQAKLNSRVVRLAAVYGPRMNFRDPDPLIKLLKKAVLDKLSELSVPLDFMSRAIYIDDATDLIIKTVLHGLTAHKIYDGALLHPVKIMELKQVLQDPLWYETRGFSASLLPAWPTPNLLKTEKELAWKTKTSLIQGLKATVQYFKDNPDLVENLKDKPASLGSETKPAGPIQAVQRTALQELIEPQKTKSKKPKSFNTALNKTKTLLIVILGTALILYSLVYPLMKLGLGFLFLKQNLAQISQLFSKGDFNNGFKKTQEITEQISSLEEISVYTETLSKISQLKSFFNRFNQTVIGFNKLSQGMEQAALGGGEFEKGLAQLSGNQPGDQNENLKQSFLNFQSAQNNFNYSQAVLANQSLQTPLPDFLKNWLGDLATQLQSYQKSLDLAKTASFTLPELANGANKSYLILLEDNSILRGGGGVVTAYAQVDFKNSKLSQIKAGPSADIDKKLPAGINPPADLAADLGLKNWDLTNSASEVDFPTDARMEEWLYSQGGGGSVEGVVMIDTTELMNLLTVVGEVNNISADNFFSQAADPKTQALVLKEVLNRMFYLSQQNWLDLDNVLAEGLFSKQLMVYFNDPSLESYFNGLNWNGQVKRITADQAGSQASSLILVENNISNVKNSYIQRNADLEIALNQEGETTYTLNLDYLNLLNSGSQAASNYQQAESAAQSSTYKERLKIYLPSGYKLIKGSWGGQDVTSQISSFSDYGQAGYSIVLSLDKGEEKNLKLQYQDDSLAEFKNNQLTYTLSVLKQPGEINDKFKLKFKYSDNLKLLSPENNPLGEIETEGDLSSDQTFKFSFLKTN